MSEKGSIKSENPNVEEQASPPGTTVEQEVAEAEAAAAENEKAPDLTQRVAELEGQLAEYKDRMLRLMAEFDNYKKRTGKEKEGLACEVKAACVLALLPVLDNLERALTHKESSESSLAEGITLVVKQFTDSLQKLGVCEIEAMNQNFDPEKHNAVAHVEDESVGANTVVEVFEKGYMVQDKIIRHAMVKVAN